MRVAVAFVILLMAGSLLAKERWILWPKITGVKVSGTDKPQSVYRDPNNQNQFVIYPSCWQVDRETEVVVSLNCNFSIKGGQLYWDSSYGKPIGVVWGDGKMELSFWSLLFRRPEFTSTSVAIWDNGSWIKVTELPEKI